MYVHKPNPLFLSIHKSMASMILKPKRLRNTLLRVLSFAAIILALKHALFLSLAGSGDDETHTTITPTPSTTTKNLCVSPQNTNHIFFGCLSAKPPPTPPHSVHLHRRRRDALEYYSSVFQDLISQGFLSTQSRSLCLGDSVLVSALKAVGVSESVENRYEIDSDAFDFGFSAEGRLETAPRPAEIADEVGRSLKPGGFFVIHTNSAQDSYSLNSLVELFDCCRLISAGEIDGLDSPTVREIVMKKDRSSSSSSRSCSAAGYKGEIALNAEALIEESALRKPWISSSLSDERNGRENRRNNAVKYLTSMVDISFKSRYVYVDVGARSYESSIGPWFVDQYPKQGKEFEIFAVESNRRFHGSYEAEREGQRKQQVNLLPFAAWIRNETLFFEIARKRKKRKKKLSGRFQAVVPTASYVIESAEVRGFDFSEWIERSVSRRDFVVVKMDVGGAEFHIIPRMVETGSICLVDEIFLVCHYDRAKKRVRYRRTYDECLRLFGSIRNRGVLVHQWW